MRASSMSILRGAAARMSIGLVLKQIGLALLVSLLFALWLQVPDASVLEVAVSVVLALVVLAGAGVGESWIILQLSDRERTRSRLLRGALLLLIGFALFFFWDKVIDHWRLKDSLRAGYLNSRFPHSLRILFSYENVLLWLGWMWSALEWIGAGVVAIVVYAATVSRQPVHATSRTLRSGPYWFVLIVSVLTASVITGLLIRWTPGHGLSGEMTSLAFRLGLVVIVDAIVMCFFLSVLAVCMLNADSDYVASTGMPEDNQPRTVEGP